MIDIHCHILPNTDDGASSLEDALEMAKIAQNDGIKTIINTSHYNKEFEDYIMGENLLKRAEEFNLELKKNNIDLNVLVGNEIYYNDNTLYDLDNKNFKTMNNSKYVLVEFSPGNFPKNLNDIIFEFNVRGYVVILAHVERYSEIRNDLNILKDALNEGALIQVNASSITRQPSKAFDVCDYLLKRNMVQFVGSDAHDKKIRTPKLKDAYNYIKKTYGQECANYIFVENTDKLIKNNDVNVEIKEVVKDKKIGFIKRLFTKN